MVISSPQVGHCPSVPAIASLASSRDLQYGQLNPYFRPAPAPCITGARRTGGGGRPPPIGGADPLAAPTASGTGTVCTLRQCGQRIFLPANASSPESCVRQTVHVK